MHQSPFQPEGRGSQAQKCKQVGRYNVERVEKFSSPFFWGIRSKATAKLDEKREIVESLMAPGVVHEKELSFIPKSNDIGHIRTQTLKLAYFHKQLRQRVHFFSYEFINHFLTNFY